MTGCEHEAQLVVGESVVDERGRQCQVCICREFCKVFSGQPITRRIEASGASQAIDAAIASGRDEPVGGLGLNAWGRPPLRRSRESVLPRFRGDVDITRNSDEGGEHATRIFVIYRLDLVVMCESS